MKEYVNTPSLNSSSISKHSSGSTKNCSNPQLNTSENEVKNHSSGDSKNCSNPNISENNRTLLGTKVEKIDSESKLNISSDSKLNISSESKLNMISASEEKIDAKLYCKVSKSRKMWRNLSLLIEESIDTANQTNNYWNFLLVGYPLATRQNPLLQLKRGSCDRKVLHDSKNEGQMKLFNVSGQCELKIN